MSLCGLFVIVSSACFDRGGAILRPETLHIDINRYFDTSINVAGLPNHHFGVRGLVKQPFVSTEIFDIVTGLALTPDGRIILAGYSGNAILNQWKLVLVRYLPSGLLDSSFGNGGIVIDQFSSFLFDQINAVAFQSDGSLVVGGQTGVGIGQYKFLLARYLPTGVIDTKYGLNGLVNQPFIGTGLYDQIKALAITQSNGVIVTGYSSDMSGQKLVVASYSSQGLTNEAFGVSGKILQPFLGDQYNDTGTALVIAADGSVIVSGICADEGKEKIKCVLLKYDATGSLIRSFGRNGILLQPFIGTENHDEIICLALQHNGAILAGGFTSDAGGRKALLIRYTSEGILDQTFGNGGIVIQPFLTAFPGIDVINTLVLQPDGKIVVAGSTNGGAGDKYFLARYDVNGNLDSLFGKGGIVISPFIGDGNGDDIQDLALAPNGSLIAAGYTLDSGGSKMFVSCITDATNQSFFCSGGVLCG